MINNKKKVGMASCIRHRLEEVPGLVLIAPRGGALSAPRSMLSFSRRLVKWDKFPFSTGAQAVNHRHFRISQSLYYVCYFLIHLFGFMILIRSTGGGFGNTSTKGIVEPRARGSSYGAIEDVNNQSTYSS